MKPTASYKHVAACALALAAFQVNIHAAPGGLDTAFNPNASSNVFSTSVQANGKTVIGGWFATVSGTARNHIARLNADGTLDTAFNPNVGGASPYVYGTSVQADGKTVIGGEFTTVSGTARNYIARLNADGTLDTAFDPSADDAVYSTALQADGKTVIGGFFITVSGTLQRYIARLNAEGTLDTAFSPIVNYGVASTALQADGKVVIGGWFTKVSGTTRNYIARLNAEGTVDTAFNPNANGYVYSTALQADGKIVIGGHFTTVSGTARNRIARLNADGTLDTAFDPDANNEVLSTALQADGKIIIGGQFTTVSGTARNFIARLDNDAATQSLALTGSGTGIQWLRGGSSPEAQDVAFALSTDNATTWTPLGSGTRISGGWELAGLSLSGTGMVRATARTTGGQYNGSSGLVQTSATYPPAQADTRLGCNAACATGDNIYNVTGAGQTLFTAIRHGGGSKTLFIGIQNDGGAKDSFKVYGTPGNAKFAVRYLYGRADVTKAVTRGTFSTPSLAPGAVCSLHAQIIAKTPLRRQVRNLYIISTSTTGAASKDVALIQAKSN